MNLSPEEFISIYRGLAGHSAAKIGNVVSTIKPVRFVDNSDGTVTDNETGLMWSRDNVRGSELSQKDAIAACGNLSLAGHVGWRLPTRAELLSLVDDTRREPALDVSTFPSCKSNWYWSATPTAWDSSCAWIVDFSNGNAFSIYSIYKEFVRAVRSARASQ